MFHMWGVVGIVLITSGFDEGGGWGMHKILTFPSLFFTHIYFSKAYFQDKIILV